MPTTTSALGAPLPEVGRGAPGPQGPSFTTEEVRADDREHQHQ